MNIFTKAVSCKKCKCIVVKKDAKKVRVLFFYGDFDEFYCQKCKPPFEKYDFIASKYYREVECDKEGNPIGYRKINSKTNQKELLGEFKP